ncbi:hypothetical protein HRG_001028 [Hirsutella rhossiliensis]|uniref:N-acetyltransferase domain-containing protein n=1 Tax=Hirsutella rhossiliensis TaxID=111463 RepID=A0A9P8SMU8_9HYPO|nr:uncharacterized protein HRG_01028 [Hirsutella rhossiliensis]KAH0968386.1 hypothetical protein HRG_01028 [Hirsutella rhossiliensis]
MTSTPFQVRDGTSPDDADFIVAAFDSSIAYLDSTGNGGQWGTQLFSSSSGFLESTRHDIEQSVNFSQTGQGERIRVFIAQVDDAAAGGRDSKSDSDSDNDGLSRTTDRKQGKTMLSVGAMTIRDNEFARFIDLDGGDLKPHVDAARGAGGFVFVDVVVTDYRAGAARRGAGCALLDKAKEYARDRGTTAVYLTCWTGGTGKLVPYYEKHGFKAIQAFGFDRKDGSVWPGMLMRLSISSKEAQ